ncbi:MAG: Pycsar system effector family protein [Flavobacteriaceae bacterium]
MEKERLEYTINRLDHYFDSVNNKTAVYIAINTFLTGGIITLVTQVKEILVQQFWLQFLVGFILILGIISLILLAWASIPYFSTNTKFDSLYYFASISSKKFQDFSENSEGQNKKDDLKDLRNQVHLMSTGLTKKFLKLLWVGVLLIAQFMLLGPFTYLLILKLS